MILSQEIAFYNPILAKHLNNSLSKNATYLNPLSQNKLLEVIGINAIQSELIEEITRANFFSIMADELQTPNKEICRYVFSVWIKMKRLEKSF